RSSPVIVPFYHRGGFPMLRLERTAMLAAVLAVAACTTDAKSPTAPTGGISMGVDSAASFATTSAARGETNAGSATGIGIFAGTTAMDSIVGNTITNSGTGTASGITSAENGAPNSGSDVGDGITVKTNSNGGTTRGT
ncbi:MAG TPA: hypothetical protein VF771_13715, partial [Longimicrobiaceae bacterium]